MATDGLLKLLAWLSPSFPVGAFAYSHGLESAIDEGNVRDRTSLADWIACLLVHGSPRADAVLFCHVYRAVAGDDRARFLEVSELASAMRGTGELALEATQQGESFFRAIGDAWPVEIAGWRGVLSEAGVRPAYPVAVACAAAVANVPPSRCARGLPACFCRQSRICGGAGNPVGADRRAAGACGTRILRRECGCGCTRPASRRGRKFGHRRRRALLSSRDTVFKDFSGHDRTIACWNWWPCRLGQDGACRCAVQAPA